MKLGREELAKQLAFVVGAENSKKESTLLRAYATFSEVHKNPTARFADAYNRIINCENEEICKFALLRISAQLNDSIDIESIQKQFAAYSLTDFLMYIVPNMVADTDKIVGYYNRHNKSILKNVYDIIQIKFTYFIMRGRRGSDDDSKKEPKDLIYDCYCELVNASNNILPKEDFDVLYKAVNLYDLDSSDLHNIRPIGYKEKELLSLVDIMSNQLELSKDQQIQFCKKFYVDNRQASQQVREYEIYNFFKIREEDERRKTMNKAIMLMAKMPPLDVVSQVLITKREASKKENPIVPNDVSLENGLIYHRFLSSLPVGFSDSTNALITVLFPSVFFIRKTIREKRYPEGCQITFVLQDEALCRLVHYHYNEGTYEALPPGIKFLPYDRWITNVRENGGEVASKIMAFFTHGDSACQGEVYTLLGDVCDTASIDALVSSNESEYSLSPIASELANPQFHIQSIELIPQGINNSTSPRRKMLMHIKIEHGLVTERKTEISSYTLNTDFKVQALSQTTNQPTIFAQTDLNQLHSSIRQLYRDELLSRSASGRTKTAAFSHEFTPDLTIWCSKSYPKNNDERPRLEAYFCLPPENDKASRGYMDRGKRIESTIKHITKLGDDYILGWLENVYPYDVVLGRNSLSLGKRLMPP